MGFSEERSYSFMFLSKCSSLVSGVSRFFSIVVVGESIRRTESTLLQLIGSSCRSSWCHSSEITYKNPLLPRLKTSISSNPHSGGYYGLLIPIILRKFSFLHDLVELFSSIPYPNVCSISLTSFIQFYLIDLVGLEEIFRQLLRWMYPLEL